MKRDSHGRSPYPGHSRSKVDRRPPLLEVHPWHLAQTRPTKTTTLSPLPLLLPPTTRDGSFLTPNNRRYPQHPVGCQSCSARGASAGGLTRTVDPSPKATRSRTGKTIYPAGCGRRPLMRDGQARRWCLLLLPLHDTPRTSRVFFHHYPRRPSDGNEEGSKAVRRIRRSLIS
jgi:hypothetical protein